MNLFSSLLYLSLTDTMEPAGAKKFSFTGSHLACERERKEKEFWLQ
jgi:hypothetical protein